MPEKERLLVFSNPSMHRSQKLRTFWLALVLVSGSPRILGAFLLPNAFGDAYVYIRDIGTMSTKMAAGTFSINDLYGFWLPLYQFVAAAVNVFVGNGFYVAKIVSAILGMGACLLVYLITLQLTSHRRAALLAFVLIALNPLHIFYSASAMTDVPHAFLVLATLYLCLKQRWIPAAIFAALAGFTRMESWMFIALIPLIQFFKERRVSPVACAILLLPPLLWFYISWKATGNWLACFEARRQYHNWLMTANPALAHFSFFSVLKDSAMLIVSTDLAVIGSSFVAGWLGITPLIRLTRIPESVRTIVPALIFFFAFLGLIVVAYLTGAQPIIFPRYGLILFSIGISTLAWTVLRLRNARPHWARRLIVLVVAICVADASVQLAGTVGALNQYRAQRAVADYLRANVQTGASRKIFCDEGTVLALSGIPPEKFLTSSDAPKDLEGFMAFLKDREVEYLVIANQAGSTPARLFPELESGGGNELLRRVFHASASFLRTEIWVYRMRTDLQR